MMNHERQRPVTLEDIIRLKRAERPSAEFWAQYDRELRAKQLAALVEKRPWWRTISLSHVFAGVRRFHLPLGAAAVLAVTIFSVHGYQGAPKSGQVAESMPAPAVIAEPMVAAPVAFAAAAVAAAVELPRVKNEVPAMTVATVDLAMVSEAVPVSEHAAAGKIAAVTSLLAGVAGTDETFAGTSQGSSLITENFASLQGAEASLARDLLSPPRGFETRVLPARAKPVEPLAQMRVPSGSRRSNLIASATLASTTTPVLPSDRSARGLSDERLYDTISRVNARGAGVLVKF